MPSTAIVLRPQLRRITARRLTGPCSPNFNRCEWRRQTRRHRCFNYPAALVELGSDLRVGHGLDETIDLGDDFRFGPAQVPHRERRRQGQNPGGARPKDVAAFAGGDADLGVRALGVDLRYQWQKDGAAVADATNSNLHFDNLQLDQSGRYTVVVSSGAEFAVSEPATLTVCPVLITVSPTNVAAFRHGSAHFSVVAVGSGALQYQWRFNGADLLEATNDFLQLREVQNINSGRYEVMITSRFGSVLSDEAGLFVSSVAAWGLVDQSKVPNVLASVKAISAGLSHSLGLKADGTVVAWGYNEHGQTNLPPGMVDIVALGSGCDAVHSHALTRAGSVIEWGEYYGFPALKPPGNLGLVVGISSGSDYSLALRADGTLAVWGYSVLLS